MKSKLDKLNELGELFKSGAITQEEFDNLKSEILNPDSQSKENPKLVELKELLESGTITQEEFDSLKNELLKTEKEPPKKPSVEFIKSKEALYNKGIINLRELSSFREEFNAAMKEYRAKMNDDAFSSYEKDIKENPKTTDPFAIICFASGMLGFFILPILLAAIGYISAIVSYYRLKENKNLKGSGLRIIGAILTTINILWLMYVYEIGFFRN